MPVKKPSKLPPERLSSLFADLEEAAEEAELKPTLPGWTWECNGEGIYTQVGAEVEDILGFSADDFTGKPIYETALTPASNGALRAALKTGEFPLDLQLEFLSREGKPVSVAFHIISTGQEAADNGRQGILRGFVEVLSVSNERPATIEPPTRPIRKDDQWLVTDGRISTMTEQRARSSGEAPRGFYATRNSSVSRVEGEAHVDGESVHLAPSGGVLSQPGIESLRSGQAVIQPGRGDQPAILAITTPVGETGSKVLVELVSEEESFSEAAIREWSEDERMLVEQVAAQVSLALENAQLIAQTKQALEETQARARELAILNEMSRAFASNLQVDAIIAAIYHYTSQLMDTENFYVALYHSETAQVSFHHVISNGQLVSEGHPEWSYWSQNQPLSGLTGHVIRTRQAVLVERNARQELEQRGIPFVEVGSGGAESWLGVPMLIGEQVIGVIAVQSETRPYVYNRHHQELLAVIGNQGAIAIQNARLLEETRRLFEQSQLALAETESLYQASAMLNAAQSYSEILAAVCAHSLLGRAEINVTIDLFDQPWTSQQTPETITVLARKTRMPTGRLRSHYQISALPSTYHLLHPDRPTIITDVELDPRLDENLRSILADEFHARSAIFVPLVISGQWIGYLNGLYGATLQYSEAELRRVSALAGLAAVAIQNLRSLEIARRRAEQLQTAAVIARDASSTLALDALLNRAVNLIRDGFGYSHASIFLVDEGGKNAVIHASTGEAGEEMKRAQHSLAVGSRSIIGYVTGSAQPRVVNDVSADPIHRPNPLLPDTRSEAGIPLKIGERVIGALDVQSSRLNAFTSDDVAVLLTLADQLAVAVDNARAYALSQQAVEEMRQADRVKSQFLANMSHELRTPLNSIIGFSRVILKGIDGPVTDLQQQDLTAIYNSGQHLLNLINDILDLSKIEAGKMELSFEDNVNLGDLINSVMSTAVGLVKDKPIQLSHNVAANLPLLRADPLKVRQILLNLLSNAAKFTEKGSIRVEARLQNAPDGRAEVLVSVSDTGAGINPEDQKKLFQPFSQVDASPTRKTGGSGLGLSICRHLVEMHGGRIGLSSTPGEGSTFYFTLPVPPPRPRHTQELRLSSNDRLVLCIEDEPQVIELYQRYLSGHGYQVYALLDANRAVEYARKLQPYAITLDVMMPTCSGWQVLQALKADPLTARIPVIICSILEEHGKGFSLGATDYLTKPILEDDLVYALNRLNPDGSIQEILVVDDNPDDQRLIKQIFQGKDHYRVILADNGEQALKLLGELSEKSGDGSHPAERSQTHLIVLDLFMPGMDGFKFLENLRARPIWRDIPVIVYTAGDLNEEQLKRLSEFSQAMLRKGLVSEKELFNLIEQTLRRYSRAQAGQ